MAELQNRRRDLRRRIVGYGVSSVVVGGLVYAGFIHEAEPDPFTLMGSVDIQLRLAAAMPAEDDDGQPVKARLDLLDQASVHLQRIRQSHPDWAPVYDYCGFLAYLEGRYLDAAKLYEVVRAKDGCSEDMHDKAIINQARMLRMAGQTEQACALLSDHESDLLEANAVIARNELARARASVHRRGREVLEDVNAAPQGR